jgi:hypothetical protein
VLSLPPPTISVWPSAAVRAISAAAVVPAAPALFKMTIGTGKNGADAFASARAITSLPPPGANPTTMVIGFVGCHAASAGADKELAPTSRSALPILHLPRISNFLPGFCYLLRARRATLPA